VRQFPQTAPQSGKLRSAIKIKAFLSRIIAYWPVHVTCLAHRKLRLFAERSRIATQIRIATEVKNVGRLNFAASSLRS
jgi:hypothetical protein